MSDNIQYYTINEVCQLLRISPSTAGRGLRANKAQPWISALRVGKRIIIPQTALNQLSAYKTDTARL